MNVDFIIFAALKFQLMTKLHSKFQSTDRFINRHIGPNEAEASEMLKLAGYSSLDELINATVPDNIRRQQLMVKTNLIVIQIHCG